MKPIRTTLIMGLLAAVFCAAAAYYYPWPESLKSTDQSSTELFEEFDDKTNQVWTINIVEYDRESEGLKSFALRRKGLKWVVPAKSNFVATGNLIPIVKSCLSDKQITEEQTDNQQDHEKFGVLDPLEYNKATNRDSLGIKLTLEDVNRNVLASLIIGDQVRNQPNKYYVRKPGQPKVYIIEFEPLILSTKFGYSYQVDDRATNSRSIYSWLDPNIVGLRNSVNPDGLTPTEIEVQNYQFAPDGNRTDQYRMTFLPNMENPQDSLVVEYPKDGAWEKLNIPEETFRGYFVRGVAAAQTVSLIIPTDVQTKDDKLSEIMSTDPGKVSKDEFKEASTFGFSFSETDGEIDIDGANGETVVKTTEGVEISLVYGGLALTREAEADSLNYYMMVYARLADSMKKEPAKPEPADGTPLTEEEEKEYARKLEAWKKQSKAAATAVEEFNKKHGEWYYIIREEILRFLRPEMVINLPSAEKAENENGGEESDESAQKESDED